MTLIIKDEEDEEDGDEDEDVSEGEDASIEAVVAVVAEVVADMEEVEMKHPPSIGMYYPKKLILMRTWISMIAHGMA